MSDVPEILTAEVLAEFAQETLGEGFPLTKEPLRKPLKKWILTELELEFPSTSLK